MTMTDKEIFGKAVKALPGDNSSSVLHHMRNIWSDGYRQAMKDNGVAYTQNFHWAIFDDDEAGKKHIQLLKVENGEGIILLDLAYIPYNMSVDQYIEMIEETGIAVNLSKNK